MIIVMGLITKNKKTDGYNSTLGGTRAVSTRYTYNLLI